MDTVGIIGGGSIGLLLASYFCKGGYDVTIFTRSEKQAMELMDFQLTLQARNENVQFRVRSVPLLSVDSINVDLLFVTVKQYDLFDVITTLKNHSLKAVSLFFVQNGMSHLSYITSLITKQTFVGIIEHGALKVSQTKVIHTGEGVFKIGQVSGTSSEIAKNIAYHLTEVGFHSIHIENWQEAMEAKLIINGVINPLTAILKVQNGKLLTNEYYFELMKIVFSEISLVIDCTSQQWEQLLTVCKNTNANRSSMLTDIEHGRRTEIDAITGYILKKAQEKSIHLPYNQFMYQVIKGKETMEGDR